MSEHGGQRQCGRSGPTHPPRAMCQAFLVVVVLPNFPCEQCPGVLVATYLPPRRIFLHCPMAMSLLTEDSSRREEKGREEKGRR